MLVCVDKFGKLCRLIPCRAGESELSALAIAQLFFDNVVCFFGVPHYVLHDRDPRFTAAFWKELWKIMGCKMVFTSSVDRRADGATQPNYQIGGKGAWP